MNANASRGEHATSEKMGGEPLVTQHQNMPAVYNFQGRKNNNLFARQDLTENDSGFAAAGSAASVGGGTRRDRSACCIEGFLARSVTAQLAAAQAILRFGFRRGIQSGNGAAAAAAEHDRSAGKNHKSHLPLHFGELEASGPARNSQA